MPDMVGKCVVITGASKGIGAAAARVFADAGANVVLIARDASAIADLAGEIGAQALAVPCNVARYHEVSATIDAAVQTFGGIDVLINNAGVINPIAHLAVSDPDAWDMTIDINLKGVYHGLRAALPVMLEAGQGTIINISSGAATSPLEGWSHYCAAKAGAAMLTRMVHEEYGEQGIRTLGLSPGTVATDMQVAIKASGINAVSRKEWSDHVPPEWPARACLWMCDSAADAYLGKDIALRDDDIRKAVGLTE